MFAMFRGWKSHSSLLSALVKSKEGGMIYNPGHSPVVTNPNIAPVLNHLQLYGAKNAFFVRASPT